MNILDKLTNDYIQIARKWGLDTKQFPLETSPDNYGAEHLEISDKGVLSLIVTERGEVTKKRSTTDQDELLYWIFADQAFGKGWAYSLEKNNENEDFRRAAFQHASDCMKKLSEKWYKRFQIELDEILKENPYHDEN